MYHLDTPRVWLVANCYVFLFILFNINMLVMIICGTSIAKVLKSSKNTSAIRIWSRVFNDKITGDTG